jgi:hypothetical protein
VVYGLFFVLGILLPFLIAPEEVCTSMLPIVVYGGYAGFLVASYMIEIITFYKLKNDLRLENGNPLLTCNIYLFAKQLQG